MAKQGEFEKKVVMSAMQGIKEDNTRSKTASMLYLLGMEE